MSEAKRPLILTGPALDADRAAAVVQRLAEPPGLRRWPIESPRGLSTIPGCAAAAACSPRRISSCCSASRSITRCASARPSRASAGSSALDIGAGAAARRAHRAGAHRRPGRRGRASRAVAAAPGRGRVRRGATRWKDARRRRVRPGWAERRRSSRERRFIRFASAPRSRPTSRRAVLVRDGGEFGQWVQAGLEPRERLVQRAQRLDRQRPADGGGRAPACPAGRCWP